MSATPNAAAEDLGVILPAGSTATTGKTQASSSGTDTFGNPLSDRMTQDAARRRADTQSAANDADRRANIACKDTMRTSTASNDQDAGPADGNTPVPNITTPVASTTDTATAKQSQLVSVKDLDAVAKQAAVDPATQLAVQIEAVHQAVQQVAAV